MEKREMNVLTCIVLSLLVVKFIISFDYSVFNKRKQPQAKKTIKQEIKPLKKEVTCVDATMYYAVQGQCDKDPLVTACMYKINPRKASEHKWIALSRDLLKRWGGKFQYGEKVMLVGCGEKSGVYTIADTMNKRFRKKIDILETQGTALYKYENVKIYKI
jgi:3D (Asp-Asp-Asp) domain-containing protein